jgi:hypothetical protein
MHRFHLIGSAYSGNEIQTMEIRGRDLLAGIPKIIEITDEEIREAFIHACVLRDLTARPLSLASKVRGCGATDVPMFLALDLLTAGVGLDRRVVNGHLREAPRKIVRSANLLLASYTIGTDSYRLVRAGV